MADRLELAAEAAQRALDLQPGYFLGLWTLAVTEYGLGNVVAGVAKAEQVVMLSRAPFFIGVLGLGYGLAGRSDDAVRLLAELDERQMRGEYVSPVAPLAIHTGLRDFTAVPRDLQAFDDEGCGAPTILYSCANSLRDACLRNPEIARLLDLVLGSKTA